MRKIDYVVVILCAIAATLCAISSPFAAPTFCLSSGIGLFDSIKNKIISAGLINTIFLTLNLFNTVCLLITI